MARLLKPLEGRSAETREVLTEMVIAAYERPRWSSEDRQQREIEDFSNDVHLACLKALR